MRTPLTVISILSAWWAFSGRPLTSEAGSGVPTIVCLSVMTTPRCLCNGASPQMHNTLCPLNEASATSEVGEQAFEAAEWYEQQRPGLGEDFLAAVTAALEMIERHPPAVQGRSGCPSGTRNPPSP